MKPPAAAEVYTESGEQNMSAKNSRHSVSALAVVSFFLLAACAAPDSLEYSPRPDMNEVAKLLSCPSDRTPTCIERVNRPYSCYCMDEDALKKLLEPTRY